MIKIASKVYENVDETFFATSGGDDSEVRFFRLNLQFLFVFSSKFITIKRFKNTMSKTQCQKQNVRLIAVIINLVIHCQYIALVDH